MGRPGTDPAPNLTPGRRAGTAVAACALILAAAACGGDGQDPVTSAPPPSTAPVASSTLPATTLPATTAAPPASAAPAATSTLPTTSTTAAPATIASLETTTSTAPTTALPSTTAAPPPGTVIELVVADGELEGGARRERARLGEEVTVRVSGDSDDHVHIHGYDLFLHLEDGAGELAFTADIPGVFEIELEEAGILLVRLEVS